MPISPWQPVGLPAELVLDDRRRGDVAEGRERFAQFAFIQVPRKISDVDVHTLLLLII